MQAFCGLVMREAYLELLIAGNVRKEEAVQLAEGLAKATGALPLSASRLPERRVVRLEDGKSYVLEKAEYNPENVNSAIYQYYQVRHPPLGREGEAPKPHRSRADADALVLSYYLLPLRPDWAGGAAPRDLSRDALPDRPRARLRHSAHETAARYVCLLSKPTADRAGFPTV